MLLNIPIAMWWLIIFAILVIIEMVTLGLTTIWPAAGCLGGFLAAVLKFPIVVQILVFFVITIVMLLYTRPFAVKYMSKKRIRTNADSLIGETALVTEAIHNLEQTGEVSVKGQIWMARSAQEEPIEKDEKVIIQEIKGVKLIVKKM